MPVLLSCFVLTSAEWEDGDLNGHGVVDALDYDLAFAQVGLKFTNFVA